MKTSILLLPGKYIQGNGTFELLAEEAGKLGKKPFILWDQCVKGLFGSKVEDIFQKSGIVWSEGIFGGETVRAEANRFAAMVCQDNADVVIGIGGGKTLDMVKAISAIAKIPLMTVPTVASNDSPCSSYTVWYDCNGNADGFDTWGYCPNVVLVDTKVIASSPVRTFIAGIGDALSTWYEAETTFKSRKDNCVGGLATLSAMILAQKCRDILLEFGLDAIRSVQTKTVSPALEKVVEATILHSGIGFESGGLATAHQMANNMSVFEECHGMMHGEEVAFGLVTQLCLDDDCSVSERNRIVDFLIQIGLPVTLEDIGIKEFNREKLLPMGKICEAQGSFAHNHPFEITAESIVDAMIIANSLGKERKSIYQK